MVLVNAAGKFEEVKAAVEAPLEAALQGPARDAAAQPLREVGSFVSATPPNTSQLLVGGLWGAALASNIEHSVDARCQHFPMGLLQLRLVGRTGWEQAQLACLFVVAPPPVGTSDMQARWPFVAKSSAGTCAHSRDMRAGRPRVPSCAPACPAMRCW